MRIVIVGAGAVGSHLAERLSHEGQDVVVVDTNPAVLKEIQASLDILTVEGSGASPSILEAAGIDKAKLLIAVTSSDAVNILACHAAARLGVPRKIARVEDPGLRDELQILGVDVSIDPVEQLAGDLLRLVSETGVTDHITFGDGELSLIGGYVKAEAPLTRLTLDELKATVKDWDWLITAIIRGGKPFVARGDTSIEGGNHVLISAKSHVIDDLLPLLGIKAQKAKKVMIFGATRLARLTACLFADNGINTILIDEDPIRTVEVAEACKEVIVVNGDPTDPQVLKSEGIENVDEVLALTGWDEVNIVSCLVAKSLGVETAICRYHRLDYVAVLNQTGIDTGVSSRLAAANAILRFVRRGNVHSVSTFQDSDLEAIELQVDPDSNAVGETLADIGLPKSVIVAGIIRDKETIVPRGTTRIMAGDRVVAVALPQAIPVLEKVFS